MEPRIIVPRPCLSEADGADPFAGAKRLKQAWSVLGHPFHQPSKSNKLLEELIEQLVYKPSIFATFCTSGFQTKLSFVGGLCCWLVLAKAGMGVFCLDQ